MIEDQAMSEDYAMPEDPKLTKLREMYRFGRGMIVSPIVGLQHEALLETARRYAREADERMASRSWREFW